MAAIRPVGSVSPSPCTPRCMLSITPLECLLPSLARHRPTRATSEFHQQERAGWTSSRIQKATPKTLLPPLQGFHRRAFKVVHEAVTGHSRFQPPPLSKRPAAPSCLKGRKGGETSPPKARRSGRRSSKNASDGEVGGSGGGVSMQSLLAPLEDVKLYDVRRRDPKVNGADLYVARFTKHGLGGAKPCGRCVEWCRWAGVKRIFHWNPDEARWDALKVNDPSSAYLTHADWKINNRTFKAYTQKPVR